jgi:pimeloyl-ACP methyl ester carboxylesterase
MQLAAIAGHDVHDRLPELAGAPVTVLHGAEDLLVPVEHGREVARLVPGARLVELAGCGHFLTTDADEDYAAVLLEHVAWAEERLAARGGLARPDGGGSASLPTHAADG